MLVYLVLSLLNRLISSKLKSFNLDILTAISVLSVDNLDLKRVYLSESIWIDSSDLVLLVIFILIS